MELALPPVLPPKRDRITSLSPLPGSASSKLPRCLGKVKAISPYHGTPAPPNGMPCLQFDANTTITLLSDEDNNWWQGQLHNQEGYFPKSFVVMLSKPGKRDSYIESQQNEEMSLSVDESGTSPPLPPLFNRKVSAVLPRPAQRSDSTISVLPSADDLSPFGWYVGECNRDEATRMLNNLPNGTFLIRVSNTGTRRGEHALSIRYGPVNPVKHIKVQRNGEGMYFLVDCKMFRTIPELVQYYQTNSLERSFPEVPISLGLPYKDAVNPSPRLVSDPKVIGYCEAQYDYSPMETNQIAFKVGERIAILSKSRGNRGWWKGRLGGKVGYFPSEYVIEL